MPTGNQTLNYQTHLLLLLKTHDLALVYAEPVTAPVVLMVELTADCKPTHVADHLKDGLLACSVSISHEVCHTFEMNIAWLFEGFVHHLCATAEVKTRQLQLYVLLIKLTGTHLLLPRFLLLQGQLS